MIEGFSPLEIFAIVCLSFGICLIATSLAMESASLFLPAFLLFFPAIIPSFPAVSPNEAVGLTLVIMFFGQTSTVLGYWYRDQIRVRLGTAVLAVTVPVVLGGRVLSYYLPERWLLVVFAGVLFVLTAELSRATPSRPRCDPAGGTELCPANGSRISPGSLSVLDYVWFGLGGLVTGLVGFAIGAISNTRLFTHNAVPMKISTGTSTYILYVTLVAANIVNVLLVTTDVIGSQETVVIPWSISVIIAPVVVVGGQAGALLNSRLPARQTLRLLRIVYFGVGVISVLRLVVWL